MMLKLKRRMQQRPIRKSIELEVVSDQQITYRLTKMQRSDRLSLYGIEVLDVLNEQEHTAIPDFTYSREEALRFLWKLRDRRIPPSGLYDAAMNYLGESF